MILKFKHFVVFITFVAFFSCKKKHYEMTKIEAVQINIHDTLIIGDTIDSYVLPYRTRINEVLDSTLAYAPHTISKTDGTYNTAAGNMMADIVFEETAPIFNRRTQNNIDFVLLNHGGIRAEIAKGNINARTAYEVMPFENSIVVAELDGSTVRELVYYLMSDNRPHPISGIQVIINKNEQLQSVNIQETPFDEQRNYFVATSSYLLAGGDNMTFFSKAISVTEMDYLIRNALIDHFKKKDTIAPKVDDRFIKL